MSFWSQGLRLSAIVDDVIILGPRGVQSVSVVAVVCGILRATLLTSSHGLFHGYFLREGWAADSILNALT